MRRILKALVVGFASVLAFMLFASSAAAAISINPTTTTATASGTVTFLESTGTTTQWTCATSSIVDAISSDGTSTIASGSAVFRTCTLGMQVIQLAPWTNAITYLLSGGQITGIGIDITIPADGLHVTELGCDYYVTGAQSVLLAVTPTTPPALATFSSMSASDFGTRLGLRVTRLVSNAFCPSTQLGDLLRIAANYNYSPAVSGTLM